MVSEPSAGMVTPALAGRVAEFWRVGDGRETITRAGTTCSPEAVGAG
jgi:hypothetical protein